MYKYSLKLFKIITIVNKYSVYLKIKLSVKWNNVFKMNMIEKVIDWFRIFRAQTAADVFLLVLLPYLVAGGEFFSWFTLALALWSILVHHISFGHNTVLDTMLGWDSRDPNKRHHPLISKRKFSPSRGSGFKAIGFNPIVSPEKLSSLSDSRKRVILFPITVNDFRSDVIV